MIEKMEILLEYPILIFWWNAVQSRKSGQEDDQKRDGERVSFGFIIGSTTRKKEDEETKNGIWRNEIARWNEAVEWTNWSMETSYFIHDEKSMAKGQLIQHDLRVLNVHLYVIEAPGAESDPSVYHSWKTKVGCETILWEHMIYRVWLSVRWIS